MERGDGAPNNMVTRSIVDTEYIACACSPTGKLWRVSVPYVPGTPADQRKWATTYAYDNLGRTISVATRDGQGVTTYAYHGNTVTITDPAGRWKKQTSDVFGNLIRGAMKTVVLNGANSDYTFFAAAWATARGTLIGKTRFW